MSNIVLSCKNLHKAFKDAGGILNVLNGIALNVYENQCIGILGVSGSGKSTLLHLLGGLEKSTDGVVKWNGQSLKSLSERKKCRIRNQHLGFIYQFHHLLPEFTATENVAMPLLIGGISCQQARILANEFLTKVGLNDRAHHKMSELSGGERQRVAVARALVTRPVCVLADEPTGNLDKENAQQILAMMFDLQRHLGTSFVIVTHDIMLAQSMQSVYVLEQGLLSVKK